MSRQHIVKSVFWLTVAEIIFNISGYIVHSGVGRILGPAEYGRYGLVITLTTMIIMLIGRGIPSAMNKYISEIFDTKPGLVRLIKKQAIIAQIILIGSVTIIFFLLSPVMALALKDPTLTPLFRLSSLIIPAFAAASFYFYYYTGIHRFNVQSVLKIVRSVAKIVFIIGLAYLFKVKGSVIGYIAAPLFVFFVAWIIDQVWISKKFFDNKEYKFDWHKLISYAWPITLFMLFYEILITVDLYFVKAMLQNDFLTGIYNGALTVGRIPYYLFYALTIVLLPTISKTTSQNNIKETKKVVSQSLRFMIMLLLPITILMFVYAEPIINIFYGSGYEQAVPPMQVLVFGVGFLTVFYVMSFVFNGAGLVRIPMYIALAGMIVKAILNYILIQTNGIMGSAIATSIVSVLIIVPMLFYIHRHFQGLIKLTSFFKMLIAAVLMYSLSFFFPSQNLMFVIWSIILIAFYLLILFILQEIKKEDLNLLRKLASKK